MAFKIFVAQDPESGLELKTNRFHKSSLLILILKELMSGIIMSMSIMFPRKNLKPRFRKLSFLLK